MGNEELSVQTGLAMDTTAVGDGSPHSVGIPDAPPSHAVSAPDALPLNSVSQMSGPEGSAGPEAADKGGSVSVGNVDPVAVQERILAELQKPVSGLPPGEQEAQERLIAAARRELDRRRGGGSRGVGGPAVRHSLSSMH